MGQKLLLKAVDLMDNKTKLNERLISFMENEARSCSMDFGCVSPLYVYRMWNGSVALEDIEEAMAEIKFPGR